MSLYKILMKVRSKQYPLWPLFTIFSRLDTLPYVALASSGDSKLMKNGIGALHSSLQIQLERLALIVDDIVSQLKQDSGQVEANLQSAIILVDHISSHPEASDKLSSQLSAIIQALFDALVQSS